MKSSRFNWVMVALIIALAVGVGTNRLMLSQKSAELDNAIAEISTLQSETASLLMDNSALESRVSSLISDNSALSNEVSSQATQTEILDERIKAVAAQAHAIEDSVNKVMPSVVYIAGEMMDASGQPVEVSGSGVILTPDGYILTNKHVVQGESNPTVVLQDRRIIPVMGVWEDEILDIAVVKIGAQDLPFAGFGDPDTINVGDPVVALGHPLGLSPLQGGATVTAGIVSNLDRSFYIEGTPYYDLIQTDAAINPGNSGGPLINLSGEVIGVNSAGALAAQNISFAINVATARHAFEDLVKYGRGHHPYLGILVGDYAEISPGGEPGVSQVVGAVVTEIDPTGPSYQAGLRLGDVILMMDSTDILSSSDLIRLLWRHEVNDTITLVVQRGLAKTAITITMPLRPPDSRFL
jgi:serine protease Do